MKILSMGYARKCLTKGLRFMLAACIALIFLQGCNDFTEVDLPSSQLSAIAVFEDNTSATAALLDVYAKIRDNGLLTGYPTGLSHQLGLYADEMVMYGGDPSFYSNSILPSAYEVRELWNSSYNQIYAANAILEGTAASKGLSPDQKNSLQGEAVFIRALIHFHLYNTFGDVPYITSTDYKQNSKVSRMGKEMVFAHLKEDLGSAVSLLPEVYTGTERTRPNKAVAQALLARVCLYNGDWAKAAEAASAVINRDGNYQMAAIENAFLKDSPATLWQLSPEQLGGNTLEATTFSFSFGPPPLSALSQELYDAFPNGDLRKMHWVAAVTDGTATWYHADKYKEVNNSGSSVEYSIVLRLPEQYLIRSEARLRQGDLIGAQDDLNIIRSTAGLGNTDADTADTLLAAILNERRLELFSEFGHRFFDLKRTGNLDAVLGGSKPGWQSTDRNFPVPESELLLNDNLLPQNDGY